MDHVRKIPVEMLIDRANKNMQIFIGIQDTDGNLESALKDINIGDIKVSIIGK